MTGDLSCSNCPDDKKSCVNNLCSNGELNARISLHVKELILVKISCIKSSYHYNSMEQLGTIEGVSGKRGQVPFENLGDHIVGIKQNFGI